MTVSGGDLITPAHAAAYHGDTSALMALAKQHPEMLRAKNEDGETPAHHAAAAGMAATLESLGALDINLLTAVDAEGWCVGLSAWNISWLSSSLLDLSPDSSTRLCPQCPQIIHFLYIHNFLMNLAISITVPTAFCTGRPHILPAFTASFLP